MPGRHMPVFRPADSAPLSWETVRLPRLFAEDAGRIFPTSSDAGLAFGSTCSPLSRLCFRVLHHPGGLDTMALMGQRHTKEEAVVALNENEQNRTVQIDIQIKNPYTIYTLSLADFLFCPGPQ